MNDRCDQSPQSHHKAENPHQANRLHDASDTYHSERFQVDDPCESFWLSCLANRIQHPPGGTGNKCSKPKAWSHNLLSNWYELISHCIMVFHEMYLKCLSFCIFLLSIWCFKKLTVKSMLMIWSTLSNPFQCFSQDLFQAVPKVEP